MSIIYEYENIYIYFRIDIYKHTIIHNLCMTVDIHSAVLQHNCILPEFLLGLL